MRLHLKFRTATLRLAVATFILALLSIGFGAETASAAGCRQYTYSALTYSGAGYVTTTTTETVPYGSACRDINILHGRSIYGDYCGYYRVRFFPKTGGHYANSWKYICSYPTSVTLQVIASGVLDGTRYRIEVSGSTPYQMTVFD
jgi:hypothetical protein